MKILDKVNNLMGVIIDILFPIKCVNCNKKDEILCDECVQKIRQAERETERNIIAIFDYRDQTIKKAIWALKYHHKRYMAKRLGQLMYEALIEEIVDLKRLESAGKPIIVIPVPISKQRIKLRGYNQSLGIAQEFTKQAGKNILKVDDNIIYRKFEIPAQAKIANRKERLQNIKGVFDIRKNKLDKLKGRTIIIIDDVTTTGATITEIMKILKKVKIQKVIGFTVAH